MVEKILTNLLSNAFKFTPEGGRVTVTVTEFRYQISDIGIQNSIPLQVIAGSWFLTRALAYRQSSLARSLTASTRSTLRSSREHEGSGIGLALVKELVELHHGTIEVQSTIGQGTSFTVRLPLGRSHLKDEEIVDGAVGTRSLRDDVDGADGVVLVEESEEGSEAIEQAKGTRPIILVVEDNADVRAYIKGSLVSVYHVAEARDGEEGIEKALEILPDLIISDVMMPKKDGYEVCRIAEAR